jgi:cell division protein FtsZ
MALEYQIDAKSGAKIKVIGVGGGGGNAVNNMVASSLLGVTFITANPDMPDLGRSRAEHKIQIGTKLTMGLGAGANPRIGYESAVESIDQITACLNDTDMVFITAGMGGGTGTGAAPVIAQAAREMGILTVGVVTKPFFFEGKKRMGSAEAGIEELRKHVDCIITIPNDRLVQLAPKKAGFIEMLKKADEVLYYAVKGISDLMLVAGLINLDFADVRTVMNESGLAMMGTGIASGESRAREAALKAITSPLLEGVSIDGARQVLLNITSGPDLGIDEVAEAASIVQEAAHDDVNVIFGAVFDSDIGEEMRITVIATGIDGGNAGLTIPKPANVSTLRGAPLVPAPVPAPAPGLRAPMGLNMADETLHRTINRQPAAQAGNYTLPAYLRKNPAPAQPGPRTVGHSPGSHNPGQDDFIFEEGEYDTPSFLRKQAN